MAYQNRVDPWGELNAVKHRGTFLGNRGIIHNVAKEITTTHSHQAWITCKLDFKGRQRQVMSPGQYTELFFLDEATAFAAGHRPCAECRRARYLEFKEHWLKANSDTLDGNLSTAPIIDRVIHRERIQNKKKVTYRTDLSSLPDGTMIQVDTFAFIVWQHTLFQWSFSGYTKAEVNLNSAEVKVLTPRSFVRMFAAGFITGVHKSLGTR